MLNITTFSTLTYNCYNVISYITSLSLKGIGFLTLFIEIYLCCTERDKIKNKDEPKIKKSKKKKKKKKK
jgi:hypothetical protein